MNIEKLAFKNYYELINIQKIDLLLIIEFLQKDRKQWINQFTQTHNESVEIQKENKQLKDNWNKLKKYINEANEDLYWTNNYDDILYVNLASNMLDGN